MLKVNNNGTRMVGCSGVFFVNFEHISRPVLVFLLLTLSMELPAGKFYQVQPFDTNLVPISWTISFDFGIIFFVLGKWRIQFWHWNFGQLARGTLRNIILLILFPLNKFSVSLLHWARDQYLVAKGLTCLIIWNNVKQIFFTRNSFIYQGRNGIAKRT